MREKELFDLSYIRIFMSNCEKIEFIKIYEFKESAQDIILPYTARNYTKAALNFFKGKNEFLNIFWVGNIKPHHGVAKVVTAISKLIEADYKIRLNVYAGFENDYYYFIKLINSFNLSNSVDFHFNFEFTYEKREVIKRDFQAM